MFHRSILAALAVTGFFIPTTACKSRDRSGGPPTVLAPALPSRTTSGERTDPYPEGAWRSATMADLKCVVLWMSHILVRFDGGQNESVNFDRAHWHSVAVAPTRDRTSALALASDLAARAQQDPSQFGDLARRYSEDLTTADRGGSFGGVSADQLRTWPLVLDALGALRPGEVSRVVETPFGFHVFLRSAPPPPDTASGAHIVIAHDDAQWIRFVSRGPVPHRTRSEAWLLAEAVYERAVASPESFPQLVRQYSEHGDAERDGYLGTWSSRAPTPFPRESEALHALAVGGIAKPMDSRIGIQIIRRLPQRARRQYAMTAVHLPFMPDADDAHESSRAFVAKQAQRLRAEVEASPQAFEALRSRYCCATIEQWEDGKGPPIVMNALDRLRPGEVAREPVQDGFEWLIVKRLEPTARRWPLTLYELPPVRAGASANSARVEEDADACAPSQPVSEKLRGPGG